MNDEEAKCPDEEENEFYFESDHLALKGNKDYSAFLKTIVILEAQRAQAVEDLDKLMSARARAIKDPISFVAQLQNGDLPELPGPQKIAEIPYVDWSQYNIALPDVRARPQTRHGHVLPQTQPKSESENGKVRSSVPYIQIQKILLYPTNENLISRFWSEVVPLTRASPRLSISYGRTRNKNDSRNF